MCQKGLAWRASGARESKGGVLVEQQEDEIREPQGLARRPAAAERASRASTGRSRQHVAPLLVQQI